MVRNRISILTYEVSPRMETPRLLIVDTPPHISGLQSIINASIRANKIIIVFWTVLPIYMSQLLFQRLLQYL